MIKKVVKERMPWMVLILDKYKNARNSIIKPSDYPETLKKWYKRYTGEQLNLDNPSNYTQKIQWLKLNDCTQIKADLSDKYKVRDWVEERIGKEYLVPLISGGYNDANKIPFDKLPNRFVIKTNHGSGWNIIIKDKSKMNIKKTVSTLNEWLKLNFAFKSGLELHYQLIKPCILIEEYIENDTKELEDYKFLCFNGRPHYCWVDVGRYGDHRRNIYDMDWKLQGWQQHTYRNTDNPIKKPNNFDKMVELVTILCREFEHVRVDFYNVNGKILFGEMTFSNGSGRELIYPETMNVELGNLINIESIKLRKKSGVE